MPVVGLLASIGTLASAGGLLIVVTGVDIGLAPFSAVAAVGRGALLMGGTMALVFFLRSDRD